MITVDVTAMAHCSYPECECTTSVSMRYHVQHNDVIFAGVILPEDSSWMAYHYHPGVLHPARGGVAQKDQTYISEGVGIACPTHRGLL